MRIFLVRHGESEANVDKTILQTRPDHAIGLSPLGLNQAEECGKHLNKVLRHRGFQTYWRQLRIWHSPYKRAAQTAQKIGEALGVTDVQEHFLLGEQQFGLFDGIPDEELPTRFPAEYAFYKKHEEFEGRFWARMPLGESRFDVTKRVHQSFGTFHRDADRHGVENLVVVCHGVVIRSFVMAWCHKSVEWFENEPNPKNCSIRFINSRGEDCGYLPEPQTERKRRTISVLDDLLALDEEPW